MITTTTLANGTQGSSYSKTLAATGGVGPLTWVLLSGTLPTGFSPLSSAGVISGTPTATGTFSFTVKVTDSESPAQTATQALSITINSSSSGALTISTTSPLANATLNSTYSATVTATGGTPPYTFTLASSSALPAGLHLTSGSPSATIAGTPTATGTFQFTVDVQDSAGTPATASASFQITVTGSSSLGCPATVNLTLCGLYIYGLRGFNSSGELVAFGGSFVANNSGVIISGKQASNSAAGAATLTITGGSYTMDSSGDGRGVVTLIGSDASVATYRIVLESAANAGSGVMEEFDTSGNLAEGIIFGPGTIPATPLAANTTLALSMEGVNGSGQRVGLLANLVVGSTGCDGSSGSLKSQAGEPVVVNSGGTVSKSLTVTGSCSALDTSTDTGTAQLTISGGTPFTSNTLNFVYVGVGGQGAIFLETDATGTNQPILSGLGLVAVTPGVVSNAAIASQCPCLLVFGGTTTGAVSGSNVAGIVRVTAPSAGSFAGVVDQNAGGTITTQGTWPYTAYTTDANGVGTITGAGQPTIHFIIDGNGQLDTLDESSQIQFGAMRMQNSVSIESPGAPYIIGRDLGVLDVAKNTVHVSGVVTPTGTTTTGTLAGVVDVIGGAGSFPAAAASGSYNSISSTTGRGTGTATLTAGTAVNVIIYAFRHRQFLILDVQSANPYVMGTRLQ